MRQVCGLPACPRPRVLCLTASLLASRDAPDADAGPRLADAVQKSRNTGYTALTEVRQLYQRVAADNSLTAVSSEGRRLFLAVTWAQCQCYHRTFVMPMLPPTMLCSPGDRA